MHKEINIVSWNVHMHTFAEDSTYVVKELEELHMPDVICLQEYVEGKDRNTIEWLRRNDYEVSYFASASFPLDNSISQGILTAVKSSISTKTKNVTLREDGPRRFRNFPNSKGLIDSTIVMDDGSLLHVINFHATLPRPYTVDMRRREFRELIKYLDALPSDSKILVCGDFNFFGLDNRRKKLKRQFQYFTGSTFVKTWKHRPFLSPLRLNLDYIFWSQTLNVSPQLRPFRISDHRPIIATITL